MKYAFEDFEIDVKNRILTRDNRRILIQARAFDCLSYLVDHAGELVTKNDIMGVIWADSFVEESSLTVAICTIRRLLGEQQENRKYIQTVSGRGYRFICAVREIGPSSSTTATEPLGENTPDPPPDQWSEQPLSAPQAPTLKLPRRQVRRWTAFVFAVVLTVLVLTTMWVERFRAVQPPVASLAILPFAEESNGHEDSELLSVADAVVVALNLELTVRQMSSVLQYSSRDANPASIGRQLNTDAVVTGKFTRTGDVARAHLSLTRVSDSRVIWSGDVSSPQRDEAELQAKITNALRVALHGLVRASKPVDQQTLQRPANPESYQLYLRGRFFWAKRTDKSLQRGIGYFKQSIASDPKFALAYAGLADSYALQADLSIVPGEACAPDARAAAFAAIALDPQLADPHATLGMVSFFFDWNGLEAEKEFQRAISLNPNYATAHHWYALDLAAMGKLPEALYEIRRAQALEPLSLIIGTNYGWILYLNHDYEAAIQQYARVIELDPNFPRARTRMGIAQMASGDPLGAIGNLQAASRISGNDPYVLGLLGQAEAMAGHTSNARALLHGLGSPSSARYVPPFSRALIYIGLKDNQHALDELQKSQADHSTALTYAKVDPSLDGLRVYSQFQDMLAKMRF